MRYITEVVRWASENARAKRGGIFRDNFKITKETKILDLGSEEGDNIAQVLENTEANSDNIYIADIDLDAIKCGHAKYGFNPVLLGENSKLPFTDKFFDIVYCSSVLEHATVAKTDVWNRQIDFETVASLRQRAFAAEIVRVGRQYFVQTPARHFPVESHSWLPLVDLLPRPFLISLLQRTNKFWIKQTMPDFRLLNQRQMKNLFSDSEIICEKVFGFTKSIMAINNRSTRSN